MYEKRVARGAKWLDKVCPDWYTKVDINSLTVNSNINFVIGQVTGNFERTMDEKFLIPSSMSGKKLLLHPGVYIGLTWIFANGFEIWKDYCEPAWVEAWSKEIKKRKEANNDLYVPVAWEERESVLS